jgi:hypothetical protein
MTHKQIKLNENDFKKLVKEAVKKAVKAKLNEGFADREMDEKWIDAERQLGSENMLQEVYNYFDGNQLIDFLRSIDQDYDMGLFEDDVDDEEYDEESGDLPYAWGRKMNESKHALKEFGWDNEREDLVGMDLDDAIIQLKKEGWRENPRYEKREGDYLTSMLEKQDGIYRGSIYLFSSSNPDTQSFVVKKATECFN